MSVCRRDPQKGGLETLRFAGKAGGGAKQRRRPTPYNKSDTAFWNRVTAAI